MRDSLAYRFSLGITVLLTVCMILFFLGWVGDVARGLGSAPWHALIPWKSLILVAVTAGNCVFRNRLIVKRGWFSQTMRMR